MYRRSVIIFVTKVTEQCFAICNEFKLTDDVSPLCNRSHVHYHS